MVKNRSSGAQSIPRHYYHRSTFVDTRAQVLRSAGVLVSTCTGARNAEEIDRKSVSYLYTRIYTYNTYAT